MPSGRSGSFEAAGLAGENRREREDPGASDPERTAIEQEELTLLHVALAGLPERQQQAVGWRFGLGGTPDVGLADEVKLPPRRRQTIGRDALYELRAALQPVDAAVSA